MPDEEKDEGEEDEEEEEELGVVVQQSVGGTGHPPRSTRAKITYQRDELFEKDMASLARRR